MAVLPFDDEADAIAKANDTATACRVDLDPRHRARPARGRGVEAGNLSVNSHSSVRYSTPSAASSRAASGASSGRTPSTRSPRSRTSSSARRTEAEGMRAWRLLRPQGGRHHRWVLGIGLATVRRFAEEGASVVVGDLDDGGGPALADEVGGTFVPVDVTEQEDVDTMFRTARRPTAASTSPSTTPASRRPRTTRSSTPTSTRGAACRRSTSPRSTSAARRLCPTCSSRARGRSSTPRPSSPSWAPRPPRSPTPRARAACCR